MSLWTANLIFAAFIIAALGSGIWLLLNLDALARLFAGRGDEGEIVPAPRRPPVSRAQTWLMLAIFNTAWIACILIWIYVISGDANALVDAEV
jgi:hypothetical protein